MRIEFVILISLVVSSDNSAIMLIILSFFNSSTELLPKQDQTDSKDSPGVRHGKLLNQEI